jgi:hypothetical protein
MINLYLTKKGDRKYECVCSYAKEIYRERLGGELDFFPNIFVRAEEDNQIIGCLGLTSGIERNPLLVEKFFSFNILEYISKNEINDRSLFGEIGSLAITKNNNKHLAPILTAGLIIVSYYLDYKYLVIMTTKVIQRMAKQLDIITIKIGEPDWTKYQEFVDEWAKYSRLKPDTISIDVAQAFEGCFKNMAKFTDINYENLLPENL